MEKTDHYEILEISKSCTADEIKQAYRKLALKWHPDKNRDNAVEATQIFQKITHSYSILSDPDKRAKYDKYGDIDDNDFDYNDFMAHFDFGGLFNMMENMNLIFSNMAFASAKQSRRGHGISDIFGARKASRKMQQHVFLNKKGHKVNEPQQDEWTFKSEPKTDSKKDEKVDDEGWETEEEYSDDEYNTNTKKKDKKDDGDDDDEDYEDVDSDEEDNGEDDDKPVKHKAKKEESDDSDDGFDEQEMFLMPLFVDEHSTEAAGNKFKCKFDKKIFTDIKLIEHFDAEHKDEFKKWVDKVSKEEEENIKKSKGKGKKGGFGVKGGFFNMF